jgi:hypothetical protein
LCGGYRVRVAPRAPERIHSHGENTTDLRPRTCAYVLPLTTYADYIPEVEAENPLPEPVAAAAVAATNVVKLFG